MPDVTEVDIKPCKPGGHPVIPERDRWGEVLPRRRLGLSGEHVTMLGVGGSHIAEASENSAAEIIDTAISGGVRFFDTAESYRDGLSEERYGRFLVPRYRDEIFLMTKSTASDAKTAREHLEGSRRRLGADVIDLWQLHSLKTPQDVDERIDKGVLEVFKEALANGWVRHIGFTGHARTAANLRMLERAPNGIHFTASEIPLNVLDAVASHSFSRDVLPGLLKREMAVIAMKTLANGRFHVRKSLRRPLLENEADVGGVPGNVIPDRISVAQALNFVWGLPVSTIVTGADSAAMLQEKIDLCRAFCPIPVAERDFILRRVADLTNSGAVEFYKKEW